MKLIRLSAVTALSGLSRARSVGWSAMGRFSAADALAQIRSPMSSRKAPLGGIKARRATCDSGSSSMRSALHRRSDAHEHVRARPERDHRPIPQRRTR